MASTSSSTALKLSRARAPDEPLTARTERAGRSGAVGDAPTDNMPAAALSRGPALPALDPQQLVADPWVLNFENPKISTPSEITEFRKISAKNIFQLF